MQQNSRGPYCLCRKQSERYVLVEKFTEEEYQIVTTIEGEEIDKATYVCHACYKQVKRSTHNENFKPRWKAKEVIKGKCQLISCRDDIYRSTDLVTPAKIESLVSLAVMVNCSETCRVGLCYKHYSLVYNMLHPRLPCASCGTKPPQYDRFIRHCPSPEIINKYLTTVLGEPSGLNSDSCICYTCYKFFLSVVKTEATKLPTLDEVMEEINKNIVNITSTSAYNEKRITVSEFEDLVIMKVALKYAKVMSHDEALLLPAVYSSFQSEFLAMCQIFPSLSGLVLDHIPSIRWFLSHLHKVFQGGLKVHCVHKRYGTVMFYHNYDLVKALSHALGQLHNSKATCNCTSTNDKAVQTENDSGLHQAALCLNEMLHAQVKYFNKIYKFNINALTSISVASIVSNMNPQLLSFVRTATQSVRSSRCKQFSAVPVSNVKALRQLYSICVLLFCTNSTCIMPFHVLITEAIIFHGGSKELVRILNRIGAAASLDTSSRMATESERKINGIIPDIIANSFTAVSMDNIDILQPYAMVYSRNISRSWHGTSVQCVQPLPLTGVMSTDEFITGNQLITCTQRNKHPREDVLPSSLVPKDKRWRRTLSEKALPHSDALEQNALAHSFLTHPLAIGNQLTCTVSQPHITIDQFSISHMDVLNNLQEDVFQCFLLKWVGNAHGVNLPNLKFMLHCVRRQSTDNKVSKVVYCDVLSEKADCKSTLLKIIDKLYETFISQLNHKFVVAVGDAKTYNLLVDIVKEYGDELKWLLPYPGDWHILLNYQKALIRPYMDAGLVNLAKVSGHKGGTLTSIINASNFKRTHRFLFQVYESLNLFFLSLFMKHHNEQFPDHNSETRQIIFTLSSKLTAIEVVTEENLEPFRTSVSEVFQKISIYGVTRDSFVSFMEALSQKQDTIKFWHQFIAVDFFGYLSLYIGLHYRNWKLRLDSVKLLAPISLLIGQLIGS